MVEYKQPDPVDAKYVLDFIRKNRYQSEYSMIKPFLDEMQMLIFCVGSNEDGGNDRYAYLLVLDIPVLKRKFVYGFYYTRANRNADGSPTSAEEADEKIKENLYNDVDADWWNKIPMIRKDKYVVIVSALDWWNHAVNNGVGWSAGGTEFYCKLYDDYKKTYEQYWIEDNIYKPRYENDYTTMALSNYISNINRQTFVDLFRDALVEQKYQRDQSREEIIESTMWTPPDINLDLPPSNIMLQPDRGNYPARPEYLGGIGFEYAPMTYMTYTGRVGLTLPENFQVDEDATRIWWWHNGVEEWNDKMNFVLLKYIGAHIIPLALGRREFFSVFHKENLKQPPMKEDIKGVPYCFLRNKYFMFPIVENMSFEMGMEEVPVFPPLKPQPSSSMSVDNNYFSRFAVAHPYQREWEIYDFYTVFPKIEYLHQTDYITTRLETRKKVVKGAFIFASLVGSMLRYNRYKKSRARAKARAAGTTVPNPNIQSPQTTPSQWVGQGPYQEVNLEGPYHDPDTGEWIDDAGNIIEDPDWLDELEGYLDNLVWDEEAGYYRPHTIGDFW